MRFNQRALKKLRMTEVDIMTLIHDVCRYRKEASLKIFGHGQDTTDQSKPMQRGSGLSFAVETFLKRDITHEDLVNEQYKNN